jgi:hypothetical protein
MQTTDRDFMRVRVIRTALATECSRWENKDEITAIFPEKIYPTAFPQ